MTALIALAVAAAVFLGSIGWDTLPEKIKSDREANPLVVAVSAAVMAVSMVLLTDFQNVSPMEVAAIVILPWAVLASRGYSLEKKFSYWVQLHGWNKVCMWACALWTFGGGTLAVVSFFFALFDDLLFVRWVIGVVYYIGSFGFFELMAKTVWRNTSFAES